MDGSYIVAVVGGACAGSEIAAGLAELGMKVVVIDQNPLPYGKILDGLPRWHSKLQAREMRSIDAKLAHDNIHFLPSTRLGDDISMDLLLKDWKMSMVILATGAWRDRPLRVAGVDQIKDDSLIYQNPLVLWFNHYHESGYSGKHYDIQPGAVIIGGGLASIDMAKICQFEQVKKALNKKGLDSDFIEMEHQGVFKVLEKHGLSYEDLYIAPARLFYRKRIMDMPLVPLDDDASEEKLRKAEAVREKVVANACARFGFEVYPLHAPEEFHTENGSLTGVTFRKNAFENGRFVDSGERVQIKASQVISSIGSIPEALPGIPMDGELMLWEDRFTGQVSQMPGVYCVGNAITGRGNIRESQKNAKRLGSLINAGMEGLEPDYEGLFKSSKDDARVHVDRLINYLKDMPLPSQTHCDYVLGEVQTIQKKRGYPGQYETWRDQVLHAAGATLHT